MSTGTDQARWLAPLGPCDSTPAWWERWTDAITRAPAFDDADGGEPYAPNWSHHVDGATYTPIARSAMTGPLLRWGYRVGGVGWPAPTDRCAYVVGGRRCNGACL